MSWIKERYGGYLISNPIVDGGFNFKTLYLPLFGKNYDSGKFEEMNGINVTDKYITGTMEWIAPHDFVIYDDPDKEDQLNISSEEKEETKKPELVKIKKVKGWKPKSREYEPEIQILKDVTGNSTCEGTTNDFTKLFVNRFDVLRKILRNQRREIANVIPINRINKNKSVWPNGGQCHFFYGLN